MNVKKKTRMDRIELPECIIHHILSYLSTKEVVGTCVLSKRWFQLNASYSVLDFEKKHFYDQENSENVSRFRELVYNSLHCFSQTKFSVGGIWDWHVTCITFF
ncbi:hypothetical protein SLA2020_326940 [Shorea laevis]